ncbi:rhodanese-like domain-containing protein [Algoriphagus sediminis]|uniref:Rhodanese-like domain-containing protein n=1 Tax=Algoriphagus sediminis TaxID=3057113 RepID=A0ABT7Y869_9BACT|nr:rhodanese-like domain-containing protein [Algoriphagus sediminis]MDN3202715.1 rhodanese-like domain-containing protein [Algoriphagus sediminis]
MSISSKLILLPSLIFFLLSSHALSGQSLAYEALLNTIYRDKVTLLKPEQIQNLNSYQILDTREKNEFEVSHLNGASCVGYDNLDLEKIKTLDKNKPVLVYCTVGARSQDVGEKLIDMGFKEVYNLYGGIIHWVNEENPVFHNDDQTDQVHTYSKTWGIWLNRGEKVYD